MAQNWDEDTSGSKDVLVYSFLGAGLFIELCTKCDLPILNRLRDLFIPIKESVHSFLFQ